MKRFREEQSVLDEKFKRMVSDFIESSHHEKPLMLVFHGINSTLSSSNIPVDECRRWLDSEYRCCRIDGHPFCQGEYALMGDKNNLKKVRIKDHPELMETIWIPDHFREDTQVIIYHVYFEQLKKEDLEYTVGLSKKTSVPAILLINDYSFIQKDPYYRVDLTPFEVVHWRQEEFENDTIVTAEEREKAVVDEQGLIYTADGKKLIGYDDTFKEEEK